MLNYQVTSAIIGLIVAGAIIWLVRRDHLHGRYALWWLLVACAFAIIGVVPQLIDSIASFLGINYPPILIVILGFVFVVLKMITMDIERSKAQVKLHRLAQRLAIHEAELKQARDCSDHDLENSNNPDMHGQ
ncbi:MAG: DUF2304 domain-containing protein [Coleofasciculus sp. C2-GNP5-27]